MRHIGNSGKIAIAAVFAALGMLILTAITLEEAVMFTFLGAVGVGYLASVAEVFARRRYMALVLGSLGTSLCIGLTIAFLRMWGLALGQNAEGLGAAATAKDSDIYFYLAAATGSLTLLVLFAGAVWPPKKQVPVRPKASPAKRRPATAAKTGARR